MRSNPFIGLKRYQQSAFYYSDGIDKDDDKIIKNRPDFRSDSITYMLIDDIESEVIPFSLRNSYIARIEPENAEYEKIISNAISNDRDYLYFRAKPLTNTIRDFFQSTAKFLASYGECIYEFVDLLDQETDELKAFDLSLIQPQTLKRKRKKRLQYIPETVAAERNIDRYIPIELERLLEFRLPEQFHKKWIQTMKDLAATGNLLPEFGFPIFGPQQNRVPFDFSQHNTLREQFIARLGTRIN